MALLPPPRSIADLETTFGRVRVYEFAAADPTPVPAVLLPGRASGVPMWTRNLPDVAAVRTTYALDALGDAGMSIQTRPIREAADQADWLDQVLARLPGRAVHLVGHSFGGWLAANYAARRPERVRTLTLLEPVLVFQGLRRQVYLTSLPTSLPFLPRRWRDHMLAAIGGGPIDPDDPVAQMISAAVDHYAVTLPLPRRLTAAQLGGLRMPVYAALAGRSAMHDGARAADVARAAVPGATVTFWPAATHSLPLEQAAPLDRMILDFMAAHDG
jgi:pimeloyl-ACP methyl ester carboxylesterase